MAITLHAENELTWTDVNSGRKFEVYLGKDDGLGSFEVLIGTVTEPPGQTVLKDLYNARTNKRNVDLVVGLEFGSSLWLYGPEKDRAPVVVQRDSALRALQTCLDEGDTLSAYKRFVAILDAHATTDMPGVRNRGLFANHHIRENVPTRKNWGELTESARPLLSLRNRELVAALGFSVSDEISDAMVLCNSNDENRAVAVLLEADETFENSSSRFPSSPVATGLLIAQRLGVPWLIVMRKEQVRLYPGRDGVGVGQKGQVETYLELDLAMLDEKHIGLLPLVFSATSLSGGGATEILLRESNQYAAGLGERLRSRVYDKVVPSISTEIARQLIARGVDLDGSGLQLAYSITLKILFRLLFQAYAEDRGLLPAGRNERYDANSLKTIAKRDKDTPAEMFSNAATIWNDLIQVWDAIDEGSPLWQVPAYNGGLFGSDPVVHPEGHLIRSLRLPDSILGPALQGLLIDLTDEGVQGPVDFRSLSVREFGTIYEGLLESSLSLAAEDMTVDSSGAWVPTEGDESLVLVRAGAPYFHSASGDRKATGSYFTPKFVVDHLIEQAIDPVLNDHLNRIRNHMLEGDVSRAAREFFDFRVADLAMGSGHFLVAAVDRIEAHMRAFLADKQTQVPGVIDELTRLRSAAREALGRDEAAIEEIEDASLLRRQIARRCIYGLDINPLAVELSRLALWIHTFVPGLPMSSLDHGLVCANSLTGVGTIRESLSALQAGNDSGMTGLFDHVIEDTLRGAEALLTDAANASEANKAEIAHTRELAQRYKLEAQKAKSLFDVAVAARMKKVNPAAAYTEEDLLKLAQHDAVTELAESVNSAHMPYLFPEVFLRERPGFDVLLGNPPWEKVKVEEDVWWGVRLPGFRGKSRKEKAEILAKFREARPDLENQFLEEQESAVRLREILKNVEGAGTGDPDLYHSFAWRNWTLLRNQGRAGLVLPRGALAGAGLGAWRSTVLANGTFTSAIVAINKDKWIFQGVDGRQMVSFTVIEKTARLDQKVRFAGPVTNENEFGAIQSRLIEVSPEEVQSWSEGAKFPLLQDQTCKDILSALNRSPKFSSRDGQAEFRPTYELHASSDKWLMEFDTDEPRDRIPVWGGSDYLIWEPSTTAPKAYAQPKELRAYLADKLLKSKKRQASVYHQTPFDADDLPMDHARIAFRMVTNATNTRTMMTCLIPPGVTTEHSAQLIVTRRGGEKAEAFLIGILSSIPFDWAARRWVDLNMTFDILNDLPVPKFEPNNPLVGRLIDVAGSLAAYDERYRPWAEAVGVAVGSLRNETERESAIAEVDALVALLYGLTREQVIHVFEEFHRGWDYQPRLDRVLAHYSDWSSKS